MADKVNIKDTGLDELHETLVTIQKDLGVSAEAMSAFIDECIRLRKNLDSGDIGKFTQAQADLNKVYKESVSVEKDIEKLSQEKIKTQQKELALQKQLEAQEKKNTKAALDYDEAMKRETRTVAEMQKKVSDLRKIKKDLDITDREGIKRNKEANKEIDRLNKKIFENSDADIKRTKTIGLYRKSLEGLSVKFQQATGISGQFITKMGGMGIIAGGLAASFAVLGIAVASFLTKTEKGAELLERRIAGVKAGFGVLFKSVLGLGEKTVESTALANERVSLLGNVFIKFGRLIEPIFKKAGQNIVALGGQIAKAEGLANMATKKMQELEDSERALIVPRAEANKQIAEAKLLYEDETKSIDVRIQQLERALNLELKQTDNEVKHQKEVIQNIKDQISLKEKAGVARDEDDRKLQEAQAKLIELETESMLKRRKLQSTLNEAKKKLGKEEEAEALKALETKKSAIDEEMSLFESATAEERVQITLILNEKIKAYNEEINAAKLTEETKQKLLKETAKISKDIDRQNKKDIEDAAKSIIDNATKAYEIEYNEALRSGEEIDKIEELFLKNQLNRLDAEIEASNMTADEKIKAHEKVADARRKLEEESYKNFKKYTEQETKDAEDLEGLKQKAFRDTVQISQDLLSGISGIYDAQISRVQMDSDTRIASIEFESQRRIKAAGDDQEKIDAITKKANEDKLKEEKKTRTEIAKIQRKQAIIEKIASTARVVQEGAIAGMTAWTYPFPFNFVVLGLVAAALATNLAAIAMQPLPEIPKYAKGRGAISHDQIAIVGEEGREGLKRNGEYIGLTPGVPTLMNIPAGVSIEPNKILEKEITRFDGIKTENIEIIELNGNIKYLARIMKERPETYIDMTANAFRIHAKQGLNRTERINRKYRHKC